ncbi:hypothetical protein AB1Y20_011919 [Prymnesium parvum]|uniref:EGF-like domain-containing protein n=1 Tax=Prymnesium parvum TaxID=97485 RepID=A0AB34ILZ0_PRYPA
MVGCPKGCGAGYCDAAVGECVCVPGAEGAACEELTLPSCRVSAAVAVMPCEGFNGPMSCACARECFLAMERHSTRGRFLAIKDKICFEAEGRRDGVQLSDVPANLSGVRFYSRWRLPVPRGWAAAGGPLTRGRPRWAELADASRLKPLRPAGLTPRPVAACPAGCSGAGTCASRGGAAAACACHRGFAGAACERSDGAACVRGCSRRGKCVARFCLCEEGAAGVACERPSRSPARYVPTFVYPLPTHVSLLFAYQRDPTRRGLFYGNRVYLEMLHARGDALVDDPEQAALFFIPVMLMQMRDSLWEAKRFLPTLVDYIRTRYPYWNRSHGEDHYIFTSQDLGGCWVPPSLRPAIIVSHFGFVASLKLWINSPKWLEARERLDVRQWLRGANNHSFLFPKCYRRHKDVVVPVDLSVPRAEREAQLRKLRLQCAAGAPPSPPAATLLYMAGSVVPSNQGGAGFYSQGVRQYFHQLHQFTPGVVYDVGGWGVGGLRDATFCLAPSGWGYGWRVSLSLAMLCVPVIIQPLVEQPFHDMLPYAAFSLRFDPADIPLLPAILRRIRTNRTRLCELRLAAARYWRALLWEPPGVAYDMLQLALCRRALMRALRAQEALPPARRRLPPWYKCATLSADELLRSIPAVESDWRPIEPSPSGGR